MRVAAVLSARLAAACLLAVGSGGCSIRAYATSALADTFAGSGTGLSSDEDPELVRDAAPFALKLMEQILDEQPRHVGLLTTLASSFTSYAYAFVQVEADELQEKDVARARPLQIRARKLFLRARNYALRGLEVGHPGLREALASDSVELRPRRAALLATLRKSDVPLAYWAAASWALAISDSRDDLGMVAQLPQVEALMARAYALDPDYDLGSIHEFYISYEGGKEGSEKATREHLAKALALSEGKKIGGLVSFAEAVDVTAQNRSEFKQLLERALGFDVASAPAQRIPNLLAQRRARWLLGRIEELFAQ